MRTNPAKKILLIILSIFVFSSVTYAGVVTEVGVDKSTIVTVKKPYERISVANPSIADVVTITPTQLLLVGKSLGATTLIVWEKGMEPTFFDVRVVPAKVKEPEQVLLEVIVADIDRTRVVDFGFGMLAKGSSGEGTGPGLIATPSGNVGDGAGKRTAPGINSFDFTSITPQIAVSHYKSGLAAILTALENKGLAKILAKPNLIVRSGEKGNFLAGQKIPIQTVTGSGASATPSIQYEQVGVRINFAPVVLEDGTIRLKIDPAEVSSVGATEAFSSGIFAPIIDTREVHTDVNLKEGESLVLAGLLDDTTKKSIKKFPILGDIPILGALFRSTDDELDHRELTFIITPRIVKSAPLGDVTQLPAMKPLTPQENAEFNWMPVPGKAGDQKY